VDVVAQAIDLVRALTQNGVEFCQRGGDEVGVGDPGAVEAVAGLASLSSDTRASARSVASASRRFGMKALIPPMAWAPRLWQVATSSSV
jgi:hypothetical protein